MSVSEAKNGSTYSLVATCFYYSLFIGISTSIRGFLLPQIQEDFNISYTETGLMFLVPLIPSFFGSLFGGYIFDKYNKKLILIFFGLVNFILLVLIAFLKNYSLFIFTGFILSITGFVITIGTNIGISDFFTYRLPKYRDNGINILHFLYAFGTVFGLLFGNILFNSNPSWRFIYKILGLSSILIFIGFIFSSFPSDSSEGRPDRRKPGIKKIFSAFMHYKVLMYSLAVIFYAGAEMGLIYWLPTLLEKGYGESKNYVILIFILFLLFFTIGRFLGTILIQKINQYRMLIALCILESISILLAFVFRIRLFGLDIFIPLCGLFLSVIFPMFQNFILKDLYEEVNIMTGILFASDSVGCTLLPFTIGVFNDLAGVKYGILLTLFFVIIVIPFFVLAKQNKSILAAEY